MTERTDAPPVFRYEQLNVNALDCAMDECGEVHLFLDRERAELFRKLLEVQTRHDRLVVEQPAASVRFVEAARSAWFVFRLSVFHGRLFEAQRLAFVLSSSQESSAGSDGFVLFRFVR